MSDIRITGANEGNLKNISLQIPKINWLYLRGFPARASLLC